MTLDEAIAHAQERADRDCTECAAEHRQLAEWLKELKAKRKQELRAKLKAKRMPQWIPCNEGMPARKAWYLVTNTVGYVRFCWWDDGWNTMGDYDEYTAWMPFPEPYKGES